MDEAARGVPTMPRDEQRGRMRLMRDQARERNGRRRARQRLLAASRLRERQRIRCLVAAGRGRAPANV